MKTDFFHKKIKIIFKISWLMLLITLFVFSIKIRAVEPLGGIGIRLSGNIVAQTCSATPEDVNKTVELGSWPTKQLRHIFDHSTPVPFTISLENCTGSGVTVAFSGANYQYDNTLLALSSDSGATGVAIEIMDINHNRIDMGSNSEKVTVDSNGNVRLKFLAQYIVVAAPPTAGSAYADSEFTLTYD